MSVRRILELSVSWRLVAMKTTLLAGTAAALSLLSSALADETEQPSEAAAPQAAGVWYGVYTDYGGRGFGGRPRAGTNYRQMGFVSLRSIRISLSREAASLGAGSRVLYA